jgi:hypothetical protein
MRAAANNGLLKIEAWAVPHISTAFLSPDDAYFDENLSHSTQAGHRFSLAFDLLICQL